MSVVPQKSDCRAHHGTAENRQLARQRHVLQPKIVRKGGVAADVGEDSQRTGSDHRATDRQAVQAISQIYGIA